MNKDKSAHRKSVNKWSYEGLTLEIIQGKSGQYRCLVHGVGNSGLYFKDLERCRQEAFRIANEHLSFGYKQNEDEEINKIFDDLKNSLSTINKQMAFVRKRIKRLEEIVALPELEE